MAEEYVEVAWDEAVFRPLSELTAIWPRILAAVDALDLDPQTRFEDFTPRARYLLGVHAGAAWTLGATKRAPMSWQDRVVAYDTIADEQATAVQVSNTRHDGWEEYARGVARWMFYLIGIVNDLALDN